MQRYGLKMNREQRLALIEQIQAGKWEFVWRESYRVTHWRIEYEGVQMVVVYDGKRNQLVTVLFENEEGEKEEPLKS